VTKTKQLLFLMLLVLVVIIGFTLIPSDTPDAATDTPFTNDQGKPTPPTLQNEKPSIEPETLLVSLREAGVTDLNLETYTEGPYTGPRGSLMDIFSHRTYYTSNIEIGNGLLKDGSCCHSIVVYEFDDIASAEHYAATLSTTSLPFTYVESKVSWSTEARLYLARSSIVGYVGDDATVIEELDSTLGKPFIVGNTVFRSNTILSIRDSPIILTSDFSLTTDIKVQGTAFIISRDGITLDLQGHKVFGSEVGDGVLLDGRKNVTVTNGLIAGFVNAVRVTNSHDNVISKIAIRDFSGISVNGNNNNVSQIVIVPGTGPEMSIYKTVRNTGIHITGNTNIVWDNQVAEGPISVRGDENEVLENKVSRSRQGIYINGNGNMISGNQITDSRGFGVNITGYGNEFSDNGLLAPVGLTLIDSINTKVLRNQIYGLPGILFESSFGSVVQNNSLGSI